MRPIASLICLALLQWLCYFVSPNTAHHQLNAQCPTVASILVDACPTGGEAENEYVIINTGGGFTVGDLTVDFAAGNNAIGAMGGNNDINTNVDNDPAFPTPCGLQPGDPSIYTGGCNVIPVGPGFMLPPNAIFILQTSNDPFHLVDLSGLCSGGQDIYVAQNSCDRSIGAFTNGGSGTRTTNFTYGIGGCDEAVTYDRSDIDGGNGAYYAPCLATPYGNVSNCSPPDLSSCFDTPCPDPETQTFEVCVDGPTAANVSLLPAASLWSGASSVTFHNSMADAMNNASPQSVYNGSTALPVTYFARVVYPDGCVVIGTLIVNFLQPDGNAGTNNTIDVCANTSADLLAALGTGVTAGSFSDDDGTGVILFNPSNVDFTGVPVGTYNFTYTTFDDPGTPCPPDMATVTVNILPSPVATPPADPLRICFSLVPFFFDSNLDEITFQVNGGTEDLQFFFDALGLNDVDLTDPADQMLLITTMPTTLFVSFISNGCPSNIVPVSLEFNVRPAAFGPQSLGACETINGFAQFDLTTLDNAINGGSGATVNYSFDPDGNAPVPNPSNFTSAGGTIFATVEGGTDCNSAPVAINLTVNENPAVNGIVTNPVCNDNTDGSIDLTVSGGMPGYTFSWDPSTLNGQEDPTMLGAGTYIVTVTDANGCATSRDFTLTEPDELILVSCAEVTPATGPGNSDGSATVTVNGGVPNYTINYSGPVTGSINGTGPNITINGLLPGTYTVDAVVDASGCTINPACTFTITAPTPCNLTFQCDQLNAASGPMTADGAATFIFGNGSPDYTITIAGPTNGSIPNLSVDGFTDFFGLLPGDYTATLTDANGCDLTCMFTIGQPAACNLMVDGDSITPISCFDATDGTITLDVTGNVGGLDIQWSVPGFEDQLQATVGPGTYGVTVTDEGVPNCFVALDGFLFTAPDTLEISCMAGDQPSGPAATDGSGTVIFSGGTPPYSVAIDGPNPVIYTNLSGPDTTFADLGVGLYTVTIFDANGCMTECQFTLTPQGCTLDVMTEVTDISCNGEDNGAISLLISGNNGAVTVDWDQDQFDGQQDISPLESGQYNVTVTDASGCSIPIGPIVINEPDDLMLECSVVSDVSNPNQMNGSAQAVVTGGTGPYQIILRRLILNTSVNDTFNLVMDTLVVDSLVGGVPQQDYEFVVIDANGCTDTCSFGIFEPPCPNIFVTENITNVACPGDSSGRIVVNVVNAQEPIQYIWSPTLPDTNVVDNLPAGNYQLIVIDSFMCTFAAVYPVVQPDSALTISCMALTDESIPGATNGTASVDIMGDRFPFMVDVTGPVDTSFTSPTSGTVSLINLAAGDYSVIVTDSSGCVSDTCSFTIGVGACNLSASATVTPGDCAGLGQIVVTPSGGLPPFTYDWSDDSFDGPDSIITAPQGLYLVTVTDAAGCEASAAATIDSIDNAPQLTFTANQIACQGDSVSITVMPTNGQPIYTYYFTTVLPSMPDQASSSGDTSITFPVPMGTTNSFMITVDSITDANGCLTVVNETIDFVVSAPDTVRFGGDACLNDTITIEGNDYFATNPSDTFLLPGGQCGLLYEINYNFVTPEVDTLDAILCQNDSLLIGMTIFDENNREGEVNVGVPSTLGCDSFLYVRVDFFPAQVVDTLELTICPTDSFTVGDMVFDNDNPEGLASLDVPNVDGCDSLLYVRIDFFPIAQGSFTATACEGDTVFVGNDFYTVDNPDGVTVLENASVDGCDSLLFVVVNFQPTATVRLTGNDNLCLGDSLFLEFETANGGPFAVTVLDGEGNTYNFTDVTNGSSFPVTPQFSTTFTLVSASQGGAGCPIDFSGEADVQVSRLLGNLQVGFDLAGYQISCNGASDGSLTASVLEGIPPYTFNWDDGTEGPIRENLGPGNYILTITDAAGCERVLSENLQEPPPLLADPMVIPPGCNETEGILVIDTIRGGVGPYELTVDGTFFQEIRNFPYVQSLPPNDYQLEIRDLADCPQTFTFTVPPPSDPQLLINADTTLVLGDSLQLFAQTNFTPDSIRWDPANLVRSVNSLSTMATPTESTRFTITVSDTTGCRATATVFVLVDERVPIYVPTAFSPNTDGANDLFQIFGNAGVERVNAMRIYDRWGEMVYEQLDFDINDTNIGWDGKHRDKLMNPQVLVYYINATLTDGRVVELKGDLTLLR